MNRLRESRGSPDDPNFCEVGGIHGDEVNGIEIARRVATEVGAHEILRGALIVIPIASILAFRAASRYSPDGRDLNRFFPGRSAGRLTARIAHHLFSRVLSPCTVIVDLHARTRRRTNLPQVRVDLEDRPSTDLAHYFGVPVVHSRPGPGTLREAAARNRKRTFVYEAGQAHRFGATEVQVGVQGLRNILVVLRMFSKESIPLERHGESYRYRARSGQRCPSSRYRPSQRPDHRHGARSNRHDRIRPGPLSLRATTQVRTLDSAGFAAQLGALVHSSLSSYRSVVCVYFTDGLSCCLVPRDDGF